MRKIIFLILFFIPLFFLDAQNILFYDDFSNNTHQWPLHNSNTVKETIRNKQLQINHLKEKSKTHLIKEIFLNPEANFSIETKITQKSGKKTSPFGLVWGYLDTKNYYGFNISSSGFFTIYAYKKGHYKSITKKWIKSKEISNKSNSLIIEKKNKTLSFYINKKKVYQVLFPLFFGNNIGFEVYYKTAVVIDYLKIKHPPLKINVTETQAPTKKENLGSAINSPYKELAPLISYNDSLLFITREGHPENLGDSLDQDIWIANRLKNGNWSVPKNIKRPLNTKSPNFVVAVSPNEEQLYIADNYQWEGLNHPKNAAAKKSLATAKKQDNNWELLHPISINNYYNNSKKASFTLSSDMKVLVMSLERDDTYGQQDLYVAFLQENGVWSVPKNIGPIVNTFTNDITPFLAADNKTLYFSTSGWPGYGKEDIFVTKRKDSSWTNWTTPQNLGPNINSKEKDYHFTTTVVGEYAYFSTEDTIDSFGKTDIFRAKLEATVKPYPVVSIYGNVLDKKTEQKLLADVVLVNSKTGEYVQKSHTSSSKQQYNFIITEKGEYRIFAKKEHYYPLSEEIIILSLDTFTLVNKNIYLEPLKIESEIILNNIFFEYNSAVLLPQSFIELNQVVDLLYKNDKITIMIIGHTDNQGTSTYNTELSKKRAQAVKQYLISKSIAPYRLQTEGYGESRPQADNSTVKGRERNRRVSFKITHW